MKRLPKNKLFICVYRVVGCVSVDLNLYKFYRMHFKDISSFRQEKSLPRYKDILVLSCKFKRHFYFPVGDDSALAYLLNLN